MLGGAGLLGRDNEIGIKVGRIPAHSELRVSFFLYGLDSWDMGHNDRVLYYANG